MSRYTEHVGARIRLYRKLNGFSLEQLAAMLHKSRATISKYELGQISIDMDTLGELAAVFGIQAASLVDFPAQRRTELSVKSDFFSDGLRYAYWAIGRGRTRRMQYGVLEIQNDATRAILYLQFPDFGHYLDCRLICEGDIHVTEHLTTMNLQNSYSVTDHMFLCCYTPLNIRQEEAVCQCSTITHPAAPVTTKMLFTRQQVPEDETLFQKITFSKEEIQDLRGRNRLVTSPLPFS